MYAAQDGRRVIPPPLEPYSSRADEYSDEEEEYLNGEDGDEEESTARRDDAYLPRMERDRRRAERARDRRRGRRERAMVSVSSLGRRMEWEVHFVCTTPTLWTPGARPRVYGDPVVTPRRS